MAFFRRKPKPGGTGDSRIPLGLWMKCPAPACGKATFGKTVEENFHVCPECGFHMKVSAALRVRHLIDEGTWEPFAEELQPKDVLRFVDTEPYEAKIEKSARKTGMSEAALVGRGRLGGRDVTLCVLDFGYMGGSMGVVVGERFARAAEDSMERRAPFVSIASSGGARMHEGALSLMQLAKTSAVVARLREARVPFVSVLADPCTGGVSASFAAQGDLTLAEPGALIGFAGPRVIESTIKANLPEGFQRAEFLLEHGYIDRIVPRPKLKEELGALLDFLVRAPAKGQASARAGVP